MDILELSGVVLALAYVLLAMRENVLCWFAAIASSLLYIGIFAKAELYTEAALQLFFIAIALEGIRKWRTESEINSTEALRISHRSLSFHLPLILVTMLISLVLGFLVNQLTGAEFAYVDSAITCFSIVTTYLTAQKILENWLYWVAIDVVASILYFHKGLLLSAGLFAVYVVLAGVGFLEWKKRMTYEQASTTSA